MAASKRVGYAVVGLGHIAQRAILPAFRSSKKAKLVALVSGDEKKAKRLGAKFGAPGAYTYAVPKSRPFSSLPPTARTPRTPFGRRRPESTSSAKSPWPTLWRNASAWWRRPKTTTFG